MTEQPAPALKRPRGRITFVGAGPGVPRLLTVAAVDAIVAADIIVLADEEQRQLLADLPTDTRPEIEVLAADDIERDLSSFVRDGSRVVYLVVGDPFMDVNATAQATACAEAGIEIDVIPGVPLRTSLPEFAGVSLADPAVQLVTLHEDVTRNATWTREGTVVMVIPADRVEVITELAHTSGRSDDEPVLITVRAGSTAQLSRTTTIGELASAVAELKLAPRDQMVVVVGQAVKNDRASLNWFESKPLFGWQVLVPRTQDQAGPLIRRLESYGAEPHSVPTISVEPPRTPQQMHKAIHGLVEGQYEWVAFTSANAVRAIREKFDAYGLDARSFAGLRIAAVGDVTAAALRAWGLRPDLIPQDEQSAAGLAAEFPAYDDMLDPINRVFLPRADIATEVLTAGLIDLGWEVDEVVAYRTVRATPPPAETREKIKTGQFDAVVFTSSSTVRNLVGIAGKPHAATVIAAIGPQTAKTCIEHGLRVDVQADNPSALDLADALASFAETRREQFIDKGQEPVRPSLKKRRGRPAR